MVRLSVENLEGRDLMAANMVAGIASDGLGTTWPCGVVQSVKGTAEGGAEPHENGIIAILIGLQQPAPSTNGSATSFQGGCAKSGETLS